MFVIARLSYLHAEVGLLQGTCRKHFQFPQSTKTSLVVATRNQRLTLFSRRSHYPRNRGLVFLLCDPCLIYLNKQRHGWPAKKNKAKGVQNYIGIWKLRQISWNAS